MNKIKRVVKKIVDFIMPSLSREEKEFFQNW